MTTIEEPVAGRTLSKEEAYTRIKSALFESTDPEEVYSERSLSKRLELGLAPIRSAIGRLQNEGLIVVLPNAGFMLKPMTHRAIADFYEVRMVVEAHVVTSLTGRVGPAQKQQIEAILVQQADCLLDNDARTFHRLDMGFHIALARLHGNEEMIRILERLEDRMHRISVELHGRHPERLRPLVEQHHGILDEIVSGDPVVAGVKLRDHLAWGRSMIVNRGQHF
ncbi:GntR family transcriptional regulator [Aureimonas glaciei]|jgi:DNA-binding GntR family transcriptional regulator|uniref:Transcriptional regulator n=1 Tax=Aureimonas glaciei TaxID=1776957 RepID=A0A917D9Y7_9HYPH|nr:GntR family transcriptional regulator [Aureimonas glaciei]GGD17849.1 transcriptional regulator [Aureimonas glaciei]